MSISLKELSNLALSARITDVEKIVAKYDFHLIDFKKDTINQKEIERYFFKKSDAQIDDHIVLSKEINPTDLTKMIGYQVIISSFSKSYYDQYKSLVDTDVNNVFIEENLIGRCFHRKYRGETYNYDFSTCKSQYEGMPVYALMIDFNGFAGYNR